MIVKPENNQTSRQHGFTTIGLLAALTILAFLIIAGYKLLSQINKAKYYNQLSDQANSFSNMAIKYITDNYRDLVHQTKLGDQIIPYADFAAISSYSPQGGKSWLKNWQVPCLYITQGSHNSIRAYLLFGNTTAKSQALTYLDAVKVTQNLGGNAGVLISGNGGYLIHGNVANDFIFANATLKAIGTACRFSGGTVLLNSIIIDLTKDQKLFDAIQMITDTQSEDQGKDPSLKRTGNDEAVTMQTNLYLDNVVKEASTFTRYYCDPNQLPVRDAVVLCSDFAQTKGYDFNNSSAKWINSVLDGPRNCLATARADFTEYKHGYTCTGANYGNADSFCPAYSHDEQLVAGSGVWVAKADNPVGKKCFVKGWC
ncbi:MAG: type II secretion system protein [Burkholderiales bacterium]